MEQHPVPQHIAAFKFKLFGNLTAKQFITLAIPLSVAALIFFSPIPAVIRYPLSLVIGIFSFIIALVPIQGRSFDQWAIAFVKAIASPTQRIWIKEKEFPQFLNIVIEPPQNEKIPDEITLFGKQKLTAYLKSLPNQSSAPLDVKEQMAIKNIDFGYQMPTSPQIIRFQESAQIDQNVPAPKTQIPKAKPIIFDTPDKPAHPLVKAQGKLPPPIAWPIPQSQTLNNSSYGGNYNYQVAAGSFVQPTAGGVIPHALPVIPRVAQHAKPYVLPGLEKKLALHPSAQTEPHQEYVSLIRNHPKPSIGLASYTNFSIENIIPIRTPDNKIKYLHGVGSTRVRKLHFAPPEGFDLSKLPIRGERRFEVSQTLKHHLQLFDQSPEVVLPLDTKKIEQPKTPLPIKKTYQYAPQKTLKVPQSTHPVVKQKVQSQKTSHPQVHKQSAAFSPQFQNQQKPQDISQTQTALKANMVPLTDAANVLSGLISDTTGNTIAGAVLVIHDQSGLPVRALKTNKLGQFLSATPLSNGRYTIEVESDLASFKPTTLDVLGKTIEPIEIRAQKLTN